MRGHYKKWAPALLQEHPEWVLSSPDAIASFFAEKPLLEIGGGKGDFAIMSAEKGLPILSLERDTSIAGLFLKKVLSLENPQLPLKIWNIDFDLVYPLLVDYRFSSIFLNFPDPWPKKRHEKRRLLTKERLLKMTSLLTVDGHLRLLTDQENLYLFALKEAEKASLSVEEATSSYHFKDGEPLSEYGRKFKEAGQPIYCLLLKKGDAQ